MTNIGRSQFEATSLMMEAMAKGDFGVQSDFERRITDKVNECKTGPLGLGGKHSVLGYLCQDRPTACQRCPYCSFTSLLL